MLFKNCNLTTCRSSCHVYTTATPRSPDCQSTVTADYSQFLMLLLDWSTEKVHANTPTTPVLQKLHWLRSREHVDFRLAVLIFRCLHGLAPHYVADDICCVADTNRRRLRLSSSDLLTVRPTRLTTMGGQWTLEHSAAWHHFCSHTACFLQPFKVTFV